MALVAEQHGALVEEQQLALLLQVPRTVEQTLDLRIELGLLGGGRHLQGGQRVLPVVDHRVQRLHAHDAQLLRRQCGSVVRIDATAADAAADAANATAQRAGGQRQSFGERNDRRAAGRLRSCGRSGAGQRDQI